MKLVFFGGVQGVGKTTLIAWLKNEFPGWIKFLNPGALFRRYYYRSKLKTLEEIEELIVKKILSAPQNSIVVLHWHYAVKRPSAYIPQMKFSRLKRIAESGKIERAILLSVEVPASLILKRRALDSRKKKRSLSMPAIRDRKSVV